MNQISKQSACVVLQNLNSHYVDHPDIVNILHCHTMTALGIKHRIYDGEFLMAVVGLLNTQGISTTMGECYQKALPHFIKSV